MNTNPSALSALPLVNAPAPTSTPPFSAAPDNVMLLPPTSARSNRSGSTAAAAAAAAAEAEAVPPLPAAAAGRATGTSGGPLGGSPAMKAPLLLVVKLSPPTSGVTAAPSSDRSLLQIVRRSMASPSENA
jgi:hypothetical protein